MADVTITCEACGNRITVSEFVSAEFLVCMKCKAKVPVPPREPPAPAATGLRMAKAPPPPVPPEAPAKKSWFRKAPTKAQPAASANHLSEVSPFFPSSKRPAKRRRSSRPGHKIWPWVLFVLLTAVFAWVRYWPGAVSGPLLSMAILTGVWSLIGLHVVVVLYAFDDDAFQGVLSAILPGYSLYYLFTQADQFYVRSLAAALLLVFGLDAALATRQTWNTVFHSVSSWIQDTDTLKKDFPR